LIKKGVLVDDEIMMKIIEEFISELNEKGFVLDGFSKNIESS